MVATGAKKMRRIVLLLLLLLAMAALAHGRTPTQIGGHDGKTLLKSLTNQTNNSTTPAWADGAINLTQNGTSVSLGGSDGTQLLDNITSANNTTNLSAWGSTPRKSPPPPKYNYRDAKMIAVIRQNHLGY